MIDVISIGHPLVDIYLDVPEAHLHADEELQRKEVCLLWGQKYYIHRLNTGVGGNALNVTVGLTTMGLNTAFVAGLGTDFFGNYARQILSDLNVDLTYVQPTAKTDTSIVMNFQGDRTILSYSADEAYTIPSDLLDQEAQWIFLTSSGFSTYTDLYALVQEYLSKHPKTKLAINPGTRELKDVKPTVGLLPQVDLLILNFEEACALSEKNDLVTNNTIPVETKITELMHYFIALGVKTVIITNGGAGAYGTEGKGIYHQVAFPSNIIEKTGAGDAYTTGVLSAFLKSIDLPESLRWGAAESASVMEQVGAARGLLTEDAMKNKLRDNFALKPKQIDTI